MEESTSVDHNQIDARAYQDKFEFYFLGLTFTILGLSLQTASFGECVWSDVLELLAWILLLISGMTGLFRGFWKPDLYNSYAGRNYSYQVPSQTSRAAFEEKIKSLDSKITCALKTQKRCFASGLVFLVVARAISPTLGIIEVVKS